MTVGAPAGPQEVVEVDAVDCLFEPRPWPFAEERAADIAAHWAAALARKPRMFDGRVLLMHRGAVEADAGGRRTFRGAYLETSFSAFLFWRDVGLPPAGVRNGFGMACLQAADGAFVLGEMGGHTANAGAVYFASGTPDPSDVRDGRVDIAGSIGRELGEETGLDPAALAFDPGMTLVMDGCRVGFMKRVRSPEGAEALVERIHAFLARDPEPELARMHVIRSAAEIGPAVQVTAAAYLRAKLSR
ncbi:NUDIX hydrolase [Lichenibacterium dinghuense]|uniref:NUDIX hydrolase n=1 Tax=Lichenibacterium dinghuense TaxID=2895977 RepID=UPI001F3E00EE|nr:NUDIX hydrolase [Lichenibacterium sp. 6Y81]